MIFGCLPHPDRRRCLSVSSFFHDLALLFVFRTVHVSLGSWQRVNARQTPGDDSDVVLRRAEQVQLIRTQDILHHIAYNASFAAAVKEVVVFAYATEESDTSAEQNLLAEAVRGLDNLRAFTWHGCAPEISADVVDALAASCPWLEEVILSRTLTSRPYLYRLRNLRSIVFTSDQVWPNIVAANQDLTEYNQFVEANSNSLRELSTFRAIAWDSMLSMGQNLTHLEIVAASNLTGFALLFPLCTRLEHLTIEPEWDQLKEVFRAFVVGQLMLPELSSLKWISPNLTISEEMLIYVADFLRPKKKLRRLDLDVGCTLEVMPSLLSIIRELDTVEVFGISIDSLDGSFTAEDASTFVQGLPPRLTALRLQTGIEKPSEGSGLWTNHLAKFPELRFVDIQDWSCPVVMMVDVLANPGAVELLGLNGQVRWIEKVGDSAEASNPWPKHKVVFRTADDLGGDDREWLMRHHDMSMSLHVLPPMDWDNVA